MWDDDDYQNDNFKHQTSGSDVYIVMLGALAGAVAVGIVLSVLFKLIGLW